MSYKTFGDFNLIQGAVLIEQIKDKDTEDYYNIIGIFPTYFDDKQRFAYLTGSLFHSEINDYIDDDLIKFVGLESIDDYEGDFEKIYDIMSVHGLSIFYDTNPFIDYNQLVEELKHINIEGIEGKDYSLELLD